jgi:hypothetical protein
VAEKTKGQKLKKGELEQAVLEEATRMASESVGADPAADYRYARKLVDIFVAGWEGKGIDPLRPDEVPSSRLMYNDVLELSTVIGNHLKELLGLERQDVKNS